MPAFDSDPGESNMAPLYLLLHVLTQSIHFPYSKHHQLFLMTKYDYPFYVVEDGLQWKLHMSRTGGGHRIGPKGLPHLVDHGYNVTS